MASLRNNDFACGIAFGETRQCGGSTTCSCTLREVQVASFRLPAAGHEAAQIDGSDRCSLATEEFDELRDDLIRRFLHEPVPDMTDDDAFNIRRHKAGLLDQGIA